MKKEDYSNSITTLYLLYNENTQRFKVFSAISHMTNHFRYLEREVRFYRKNYDSHVYNVKCVSILDKQSAIQEYRFTFKDVKGKSMKDVLTKQNEL